MTKAACSPSPVTPHRHKDTWVYPNQAPLDLGKGKGGQMGESLSQRGSGHVPEERLRSPLKTVPKWPWSSSKLRKPQSMVTEAMSPAGGKQESRAPALTKPRHSVGPHYLTTPKHSTHRNTSTLLASKEPLRHPPTRTHR